MLRPITMPRTYSMNICRKYFWTNEVTHSQELVYVLITLCNKTIFLVAGMPVFDMSHCSGFYQVKLQGVEPFTAEVD